MFSSKDSKNTKTPSTATSASAIDVPKRSGVPSIISLDLKIVGNLESSGDIQIDGNVVGDIDSRLVTVGQEALIEGAITAETVRVSGTVDGQIKAKSVSLERTAKVTGDIIHESLTMEAGARFEGQIKRMDAVSASGGATVSTLRPASQSNATSSGTTKSASGGSGLGAAV